MLRLVALRLRPIGVLMAAQSLMTVRVLECDVTRIIRVDADPLGTKTISQGRRVVPLHVSSMLKRKATTRTANNKQESVQPIAERRIDPFLMVGNMGHPHCPFGKYRGIFEPGSWHIKTHLRANFTACFGVMLARPGFDRTPVNAARKIRS